VNSLGTSFSAATACKYSQTSYLGDQEEPLPGEIPGTGNEAIDKPLHFPVTGLALSRRVFIEDNAESFDFAS